MVHIQQKKKANWIKNRDNHLVTLNKPNVIRVVYIKYAETWIILLLTRCNNANQLPLFCLTRNKNGCYK